MTDRELLVLAASPVERVVICKIQLTEGATVDKPEDIISDEEIERVHANANFGTMGKRDVVNQGVLKCASGYYQGHTSTQIITEHGLIDAKYRLTKKGKRYLWAAFASAISV